MLPGFGARRPPTAVFSDKRAFDLINSSGFQNTWRKRANVDVSCRA
jgi:hypothetical protein